MEKDLLDIISNKVLFLNDQEKQIIAMPIQRFSRSQRRIYHSKIVPQKSNIKKAIHDLINDLGIEKVMDLTVNSIVAKGGELSYIDQISTSIIGPIKVYHQVKINSEKQGDSLKAVATSSGCLLFFITLLGILGIMGLIFYR